MAGNVLGPPFTCLTVGIPLPKLFSVTAMMHEASGSKFFMPEGYCVKCKAKKEIMDAVEETMKNGRKAIKGKCPTCGTVMFKILGGKATATAAAPAAPTTPASEPIAPKPS